MPLTEVAGPTSWKTRYPRLGTGPVPVSPCLDPDYHDLERQRIFTRTWLYYGRAETVSGPGDFRVKTFEAANADVLVTRARDGQLRAFHNICPHRGRALTDAPAGTCAAFTCGLHGWTFDPDGSLVTVPAECRFADLDPADHGLLPVAVDTWQGFIFVNLARPPARSLGEYLGEFGEGLAGYPFDTMGENLRFSATYQANWKLSLDVFQDGYRASAADRPTPTVKLDALHRMLSTAASEARVVFPNLILATFDGMYCTQEFWPISLDETYHEVNVWYRDPGQAQHAVELGDSIREDASHIEPCQAALRRGTLADFTLGDDEIAVRHSHKVIEAFVYGDDPYGATRAMIDGD